MSYITILYVTYNNGTSAKKAIYDADSADLAIANVYKYMGSYMCSDGVESVACLAIDSLGTIYKQETWKLKETTAE